MEENKIEIEQTIATLTAQIEEFKTQLAAVQEELATMEGVDENTPEKQALLKQEMELTRSITSHQMQIVALQKELNNLRSNTATANYAEEV